MAKNYFDLTSEQKDKVLNLIAQKYGWSEWLDTVNQPGVPNPESAEDFGMQKIGEWVYGTAKKQRRDEKIVDVDTSLNSNPIESE